jgi:hypothetical protein
MQKEILNALLNHPDPHNDNEDRDDNDPDSSRSMRLFIEQARQDGGEGLVIIELFFEVLIAS